MEGRGVRALQPLCDVTSLSVIRGVTQVKRVPDFAVTRGPRGQIADSPDSVATATTKKLTRFPARDADSPPRGSRTCVLQQGRKVEK